MVNRPRRWTISAMESTSSSIPSLVTFDGIKVWGRVNNVSLGEYGIPPPLVVNDDDTVSERKFKDFWMDGTRKSINPHRCKV